MSTFKASILRATIAPRKARYVMDLVRHKSVEKSLEILRFCPKRGAPMIAKAIKSALANAVSEGGVEAKSLVVQDARVDVGPTLKRWKPRARGSAFPILCRTAHLTVVLGPKENLAKVAGKQTAKATAKAAAKSAGKKSGK